MSFFSKSESFVCASMCMCVAQPGIKDTSVILPFI